MNLDGFTRAGSCDGNVRHLQSFFSSTATNLVAGQFLEILTLPVNTAGAKALGATPLKPERSVNASGGVTFDPSRRVSAGVGYYDIRIDERIVFSENSTGAAIQSQLAAIGLDNVTGARYFTNAIDTRTRGVDVVANYGISTATPCFVSPAATIIRRRA